METSNRQVAFVVALTLGFVITEALIRQRRQAAARLAEWRQTFIEPFVRTPGRREWLRETLMREEQTIRTTAAADCGCSDA